MKNLFDFGQLRDGKHMGIGKDVELKFSGIFPRLGLTMRKRTSWKGPRTFRLLSPQQYFG
jgi:hypothetical protein